jgi:retron-type reverse transcriptase
VKRGCEPAAFSVLSVFSLCASYTSILPRFACHRVGNSSTVQQRTLRQDLPRGHSSPRYALARANAGAPGVEEVTFVQIDAFGVDVRLAGLRDELVSKTYRPAPARRVTIPKPGGGERIPTIPGRVVQTAAKIVLEPIFEADFEDSAYGYRPRRSAVDAVKETHRLICRGYIAGRRRIAAHFGNRVSAQSENPAAGSFPSTKTNRRTGA